MTNWHSFAGTSEFNYDFVSHGFRDGPWRDSADHLARSPFSYVERLKTPVLVIHNQEDFRAPLDQGLQFTTAPRELRKPARLAVFPESSHGISREGRPNQRIARLGLILDWFAAGGR